MSTSAHLGLPFVQASQSQKHVTVNDAFERLDVLVEANVLDKDLGAPPASPGTGDRYIVAAPASGDWAGHEDEIASWNGTGWTFLVPKSGWKAWVADETALYGFHSGGWNVLVSGAELTAAELKDGSVGHVGVNGAADDTNRLAVKSPAVLFDNVGADSRVKVSKAATGDTASHLFQTNYAARAEFGLIGDDDFTLKVSADGAAFSDVFKVTNATGALDFKVPPTVNGVPFENAAREGAVINAIDYGLSEQASAATNTAALNAAADALRSKWRTEVPGVRHTAAILKIPPGRYEIAAKAGSANVGWDLSMIRNNGYVFVDGRGAVLVADASLAGKVVVDMIGTRWWRGFLPEIHAMDANNPPLTGLQFGRYDDSVSCDELHLYNIHVRGYFTRACVHNLNAETCVFSHPNVFNYRADSSAYAWIQDGWAHWLPVSDAAVSMTRDSSHSFLMNTFVGGAFRMSGQLGVPMHLGRTKLHTFTNCYFVGNELAGMELANTVMDLRLEGCHFESDPEHCLRFVSFAGETDFTAQGLVVREGNANAQASVFGIDSALATVRIDDFEFSARAFNAVLTQGLFEDPAKVTVGCGRVFLPDLTYWQDLSSFRGTLETSTITRLYGSRTFEGNALFETLVQVQDDGFGRLQFLNGTWGGRAGRIFATAAGDIVIRPTGAADTDNADRDLYYDNAVDRWVAKGEFAVDDNPVQHEGRGLRNREITLADDNSAALTLPANCGVHFALVISTNNANTGVLLAHVSPNQNNLQIVSQVSGGIYEVLNGTVLSGATGTDGAVTIGVTSGTVYLENRSGASRTFSLSFLANR